MLERFDFAEVALHADWSVDAHAVEVEGLDDLAHLDWVGRRDLVLESTDAEHVIVWNLGTAGAARR